MDRCPAEGRKQSHPAGWHSEQRLDSRYAAHLLFAAKSKGTQIAVPCKIKLFDSNLFS